VMMTTKDEGFNVARQLSEVEELRGTPVVMVSGVRKEMNLPFGFEPDDTWLPVKQFLEKPVKPEILLKAVAEHIRKD
jgi:CheY-like chemotaxis protein